MNIEINQIVEFYPKGIKLGKSYAGKIVEIKLDCTVILCENKNFVVKNDKLQNYIIV